MTKQIKFDWENIYKDIPFDKLGWYHAALDPDLENYIATQELKRGTFLDIGTGAGNQAIELAVKDLRLLVVIFQRRRSQRHFENVKFVEDDFLNTKLTKEFDYIFDRGCYHNILKENREVFIQTIKKLLTSNGRFFLKCFTDNPSLTGPFDFTEEMITVQFKDSFVIENIKKTIYQGTLKEDPNALFVVMTKLNNEAT